MQTFVKIRYFTLLLCAAIMAMFSLGTVAYTHEVRPTIADFKLLDGDEYRLTIRTNLEALIAKIGAEHGDTEQSPNAAKYNGLRLMSPEQLRQAFAGFRPFFLNEIGVFFDGTRVVPEISTLDIPDVGDADLARESTITLSGELPRSVTNFQWQWPEAFGSSVIRMDDAGAGSGEGFSAYLTKGALSEPVPLQGAKAAGFWKTAANYMVIGFTHIIPLGLDHILFVVGLFLLSNKLRPLLWQITAFTVAHTVTLALGVLGYVTISPAIVEPLIAASIVYVAVENMMTDKLQKWRPVVVFCFGLLHGLGFAGVLGEIGLSPANFITGLISFNIGVELGQLAVITICFLSVGLWFGNKPWYRRYITVPASFCIALIAMWWVYQRVFLT